MKTKFDSEDIDIKDLDIVFFDTEMTGLEMKHDLIEIGFVKVKGDTLEVIEKGNIKIKPLHIEEASSQAMKFNHYSEEGWKDSVDPKQGIQEFLRHTDGCILAGHNVQVDWGQLWKYLNLYNLEANFYYKSIDTFSIAQAKYRNEDKFRKYSLTELTEFFGIPRENAHNALDDAYNAYLVYKELIK